MDQVAVVDNNAERAAAVCERFGCPAHFRTVEEMLAAPGVAPEVVSVVTPGKYFRETVLACARCPTIRAIQVEKPMGGPLRDADEMISACDAAGIVFAGGNMQVAYPEVQEMAARLASGEFGPVISGNVQGWSSNEYLGGGCQHIAVLRALTGQEVVEVQAWGSPAEGLYIPGFGAVDAMDGNAGDPSREPAEDGSDSVRIHAQLRLSGGVIVPCFADDMTHRGVEVRTASHLIRWNWGPPTLHWLAAGSWKQASVIYTPYQWSEFTYLTGAIRSMIDALNTMNPTKAHLAVSGVDVRASLEVATAAHHSSISGSVPISLPIVNRALNPLYPRPYRWIGGDARPPLLTGELGAATPQPAQEVMGIEIKGHAPPPPKSKL
eukprot:SAG31_NODE_1404_length_8479_cov_2.258760_11_plen_379_part_00